MEISNLKSFRLAGLKLQNKTTNQNAQAAIDCGNLWQRFIAEKILDAIPDKVSNTIFAVYFDYEKDETAPYSYFIGCEVDADTELPTGLSEIEIPVQKYVKIPVRGVMPDCIATAWRKIWASKMDRRFGYDFEVYDDRSANWSNAEIDIFVSVNEPKGN